VHNTTFLSGLNVARARLAMLAATFVVATVGLAPAAFAQQTPTITFSAAPPATYLGGNFTVKALTNSDGALAYSAVSGPCAVVSASAGSFSSSGAGACVVRVDTAATAAYLAGSAQQTVTIGSLDLWAIAGTTSLPDGAAVPVWGYNVANAAVTRPGGPTLIANQGDTVSIPLHNALTANTALLIQGQNMVPDTTGVAPGGTKVYTFTASRPGTYLYEAGLLPNAQHQVAMGLYGALIVRPSGAPLQAYADAATGFTAATDEAVMVLSEIDPTLNGSANPAAFDMRDFAPRYFLINGKAYPATDPIASAAGSKVLLRYVNAGAKHHSMAVLGLRQNFVAKDGAVLPTLTHNVAAETLAPGQTADAIATIPAAVTTASRFAVYDANLMLRNGSAPGFGGMLTFVTSGTGTGASGPTASAVTLAPNPTNGSAAVSLSASFAPGATSAEYFIDASGANGSGTPMGGSNTARTATIAAATLAGLASGTHTILVHGTDGTTWGAFGSAVLKLDKAGPTTNGLSLTPNPSNGTVNVALHGNADDTATGGSGIAAAEYFIGTQGAPGSGIAIPVNSAQSPVKSLDATINPPVSGGLVSVHSQDALGNWGPFATITLTVVGTGPSTSGVTATYSPNNGAVPLNSTQAVVRIGATVTSSGATVAGAEGFIDTVGGNGTGFPFVPRDGVWNSASEAAYGDIPLSAVAALSNGNHTIYVRGRDALGNWGATSSTTLVIDKTAPTVSVSAVASTVAFNTPVTVNVTANDVGSGVNVRQYWVDGSATPPANPTAFTGSTFNVTGLTGGTHTIYVRVQDAATNWSAVASVTVYVMRAVADTYTTTINNNTAGNSRIQSITVSSGSGVLANDQPTGVAGRTATPANPVVTRTAGTGSATMTVSLAANGGFTYTLTVPNSVNGNSNIRAAKRGTYQFTYTETLNGVTSNATATITVN